MDGIPLDDDTLQRLYAWIDEIPLSRPKKNIARDFSDGILTAEVIGYYFPKFVQMHNYSSANSAKQKEYNWNTLNRKVLKKLKIFLTKQDIDDIVTCRPGSVERMLVKLQLRIANFHEKRMSSSGNGKRDHTASDSEDEELYYNVEKASESREPQLQDASLATTGRDNVVMLSPTNGMDMPQQPKSKQFEDQSALLLEKDTTISELQETIQILEMKVQKLEQLVRLKDGKIQTLVAKLRSQKP